MASLSTRGLKALLSLFIGTTVLLGSMLAYMQAGNGRVTLGRVENVYVKNAKIFMPSRIDTGAGVASVNAEILEIKKPATPDGKEHVVFRLSGQHGKAATLEREVLAWENIKKKGGEGFVKRPVVELDLCIGGELITGRVNLADRSQFLYPLLIGRNILKDGNFLIDPFETYNAHPLCH